jgi:hypothetical protein
MESHRILKEASSNSTPSKSVKILSSKNVTRGSNPSHAHLHMFSLLVDKDRFIQEHLIATKNTISNNPFQSPKIALSLQIVSMTLNRRKLKIYPTPPQPPISSLL